MDAIGGRLINLARVGFSQERAPDGSPWKPLAAATILARQKARHSPGPILRVSGDLYNSLNWRATATSVEIGAGWGNSGPYAALHQFGGQAGRGHKVTIPARPYLPGAGKLPDAYLASCLDIINQKLEAANRCRFWSTSSASRPRAVRCWTRLLVVAPRPWPASRPGDGLLGWSFRPSMPRWPPIVSPRPSLPGPAHDGKKPVNRRGDTHEHWPDRRQAVPVGTARRGW